MSLQENKSVSDFKRKRGIIKSRLTKFSNYLKSIEQIQDVISSRSLIDLKLRIEGTTSMFKEFCEVQTKIEESVSDEELSNQLDQRESFEDIYYSTMALAEAIRNAGEGTDCSKGSCHSNNNSRSVKLPTISMPSFDGSYEHWLEFRDTYLSLVHNSKDISNVQKFHYLKSALKGSAELVIDSIEFSADNYQVAWELLLNRYNNSRLLINNHVKALFTINAISKESPSLIRNLVDTILKNIRALKILGEPTEYWDTLINYIIVSKLDKTTEREWETFNCTLLSNDNDKNNFKVVDLIQFLKNRADMLEKLQVSHNAQTTHLKTQNTRYKPHYANSLSHCNIATNNKKPHNSSYRYKPCVKCNENHPLYSCSQFLDSNLDVKLKLVRDHKLCENCLRSGHTLDVCRFGPCRICTKKHNTLIHKDTMDSTQSNTFHVSLPTDNESPAAVASIVPSLSHGAFLSPSIAGSVPIQANNAHMQTTRSNTSYSSVLLSTAIVEVRDIHGVYHNARALLDSGSQRCFITKELCDILNASLIQSTHKIIGVGDAVIHSTQLCEIEIKSCVNTYTTRIQCFVLNHITSTQPIVCQSSAKFCIPDNIRLADPQFLDGTQVDILIGADKFWDLLGEGKFRLPSGPYLLNTQLGWIISGPVLNNAQNTKRINCNFSNTLDSQLRMFWELEELPKVRDTRTEEERACEEHFLRTTTRTNEGRFCVRIPLNQSPDVLGDTYAQAERRLIALENRLQRSPEYKQLYVNFIQEYETLGHMTQVSSPKSPCFFMPHHGVFREHSTTTKLRVVFDASASSTSGKSLNDLQLVGPAIQGDLIAILLRFRQHRFVACADIEKMYRQCLVDENQRNLQMILWRDNPTSPIRMYQLNTVTYGTASAPYLSVRCLKGRGL